MITPRREGILRAAAFLAVAGTALALGVPSANAATTATVGCTTRTVAQEFVAVDRDAKYYYTAPGGTFENGAPGWTLSNATVGAGLGNEPFHVNGAGNSLLKIRAGGSAKTPIFCNALGEGPCASSSPAAPAPASASPPPPTSTTTSPPSTGTCSSPPTAPG